MFGVLYRPAEFAFGGESSMNPEEFRAYVRHAFAFLRDDYGFKEERVLKRDLADQQFQVRFANPTTRVVVLGIHWGFGIDIRLASCDASLMSEESYCFDDLLAIRAPEFQHIAAGPEDTRGIQGRQLDQYAEALRRYAKDVLEGTFTMFPRLAAAIEERRREYDRERGQ